MLALDKPKPRSLSAASRAAKVQNKPAVTAEAIAALTAIARELLPTDLVSRSEFLGIERREPEIREVDVTGMLSLILGAWQLGRAAQIKSVNHESDSAEDSDAHYQNLGRYMSEHQVDDSDLLDLAKMTARFMKGNCDYHAAYNWYSLAAKVNELEPRFPALKGLWPKIYLAGDDAASEKLPRKTPHETCAPEGHTCVLIGATPGDAKVVDSWVPLEVLHDVSDSPLEPRVDQTFDVHENRHCVPAGVLGTLDRLTACGQTTARGHFERESHWTVLEGRYKGEPVRHWGVMYSDRADARPCIFVLNDGDGKPILTFDPDSMSQSALEVRRSRLRHAALAREAGHQRPMEGSPVRGVPPFLRGEKAGADN